MLSVYGPGAEEKVADEDWLRRAGDAGWIVLTKDVAIRRRPNERAAIARHHVRVFALTTGKLTGEEQRERILANINRILLRARKPGPFICAIYEASVKQAWP